MKSIRIKVKTLLLLVVVLALVTVYANDLYFAGMKLYNNLSSETSQIDLYDLETYTLESEADRLNLILSEANLSLLNLVHIGEGSMVSSARIRDYDAKKVMSEYLEYNQEEVLLETAADYVLNVLLIQWFSGNTNQALLMLKDIEPLNLSDLDRDHFYLIQAGIQLSYYELDDLEKTLSNVSSDYDSITNQIKRFMHLVYGYETVYEDSDVSFYDSEDKYEKFFESVADRNMNYKMAIYDKGQKDPEGQPISGYVTIGGEPVEGALVFLKFSSGMSTFDGMNKNTIYTDENGYYEFEHAYVDVRRVNLLLPWQMIHDQQLEQNREMDFVSNPVKNFEFKNCVKFEYAYFDEQYFHYKIIDDSPQEGGSYRVRVSNFGILNGNDQSYITLDTQEGRLLTDELQKEMRFAMLYMSSKDPLALENMTEHLYLNGKYVFSVSSIGDYHTNYTSNGFFSDATMTVVEFEDGTEYNPGDLLLQEKKMEEAMTWYAAHPSRHNLSILIALKQYGSEYGEKTKYTQYLSGTNLGEAAYYLEALIELDGETYERLSNLASIYNELNDFEKAYDLLVKVNEIKGSVYIQFEIAHNLLHQGYYLEGLEVLLASGDIYSDGDHMMSYFLLGDDTRGLREDVKEVYEKIDNTLYLPFVELIRAGKNIEAYDWLTKQEESDLKTFYTLLFLDGYDYNTLEIPYKKAEDRFKYSEQFSDYYIEEVSHIKDRNIKSVLMLLKKFNNWFE